MKTKHIFLIVNDNITGGLYVTSLLAPLTSVSLSLMYNLVLEAAKKLEMIEEFNYNDHY